MLLVRVLLLKSQLSVGVSVNGCLSLCGPAVNCDLFIQSYLSDMNDLNVSDYK